MSPVVPTPALARQATTRRGASSNLLRNLFVLVLLASMPLFGRAVAGELTIERVALPNVGTLSMPVPDAWQIELRQSGDGSAPTLVLRPKSGPAFEILITPRFDLKNSGLRREVRRMAKAAQPDALGKVLPVRKLSAAGGDGYYFSATTRQSSVEGGYRFLTQGIAPVGAVALAFTIRRSDASEATVSTALLLLRDASLAKPGAQ